MHEEAGRLACYASPGACRPYGMQRVCRIFGVTRFTCILPQGPRGGRIGGASGGQDEGAGRGGDRRRTA